MTGPSLCSITARQQAWRRWSWADEEGQSHNGRIWTWDCGSLTGWSSAFEGDCWRGSRRWATRWRQTRALDLILRRAALLQIGSDWSINGPKSLGRNNAHLVPVAGR